jgi:hypothetical protein
MVRQVHHKPNMTEAAVGRTLSASFGSAGGGQCPPYIAFMVDKKQLCEKHGSTGSPRTGLLGSAIS